MLIPATSAYATEGYGLTSTFGAPGSAAGDLEHPEGVAVNDATGDVYVADKGNNRIDQFTSGGAFVQAWGWGVKEIGKKEELQTCTEFTGCAAGTEGTGAGQLDAPEAVAVDNSTGASKEDVYVMDNANKVIDKFSAAGVYESQLTGTCEITAVAPPACTGSTFIPFGELLGVAVDPSGNLWVLSGSTVYEFSDTGVVQKSFYIEIYQHNRPGLAVDSAGPGHVYANRYGGMFQFEATTGAELTYQSYGQNGESPTALAIDPAGGGLLAVKPNGTIAEYGPITESEQKPLQTFPGAGEALSESRGIAVNGSAAGGAIYATESIADSVVIFSEGPKPEAPNTLAASGETQTTAMLEGELNPGKAKGELKYQFVASPEGTCSGHPGPGGEPSAATRITPVPAGTVTEADEALVNATATDLEPSAKYTVCLVAINKFGETFGNPVPFDTEAAPPTVIGLSESSSVENMNRYPSRIEETGGQVVRLNASINPNNEETGYRFEYSTEGTEGPVGELTGTIATTAPGALPAGFNESGDGVGSRFENSELAVPLQGDTTYYYRVLAENEQSKTEHHPAEGEVDHFETAPEAPEDRKPEPVAHTSATLRAVLNPKQAGDGGTYEFRYALSGNGPPKDYSCHGEGEASTPATAFAGGKQEAVSAEVTGLMVPAVNYTFCLIVRNRAGTYTEGPPETFQSVALPPVVESESSSFVETGAVTFEAKIDPEGAATAYHFEYGPAAGDYDVSVPIPDREIAAGVAGVGVVVRATGLAPSTTYHYRVVASNVVEGSPVTEDGPDQTFMTLTPQGTGSPANCPNEQARAEQPFGLALPDCRAYEQVSPLNKEGGSVEDYTSRAAVSGGAIVYLSENSFSGPKGAQLRSVYLSRRGPDGWGTQNITQPIRLNDETYLNEEYVQMIFTPELTKGTFVQPWSSLSSDFPAGYNDLYVTDFAERSDEVVNNVVQPGIPPYDQEGEHGPECFGCFPYTSGGSVDFSHVVFSEEGALTPGASPNLYHPYEWVDGHLYQVDVPPAGTTFPNGGSAGAHGVSENGLRVVFAQEPEGGPSQVYVRENPEQPPVDGSECAVPADACTVQVSASQRKTADPRGPQPASFVGASADGSRVFFTSNAELTEDAYTGSSIAQEIVVISRYDEGAFTLSFNGQRTAQLPYNATAKEVQEALEGLSSIGAGNVTVTGREGPESGISSSFDVTFGGILAGSEPPLITAEGVGDVQTSVRIRLGANLYEYDLEDHELTDLTLDSAGNGAAVGKVLDISEEGSYVYFVAEGKLATNENSHHDTAQSGERNLYLSHDGTVTFIATLSPDDLTDQQYEKEGSKVSGDGTHLAFISERSLTGYDNQPLGPREGCGPEGCDEIYLFDASTGSLVCASCDPSGARPVGAAWLSGSNPRKFSNGDQSRDLSYVSRNLSEDGSELFFDSPDPLLPHASNGLSNVYEYENGHLYLISDGAGRYESDFLDASANGKNVFFTTADGLLPSDQDERVDVYDARVEGGFPVPASPSTCDNGDSCKGPASPQPGVFGAPASATFSGAGNPAPEVAPPPKKVVTKKTVKCKKPKKLTHGKCLKPKKKSKAKKSTHHKGSK